MPASVADELSRHMDGTAESDFVFPGPEGGPLRPASWRQRFWHPAVRAAGLLPLRPHDLRHTAVAQWIANGANPKQITALARHTSVSFTLDRYGHLFPAQDEELMSRLDRAFEVSRTRVEGAREGHGTVVQLGPRAAI